ncbi:MAG TPA: HAMP domain-containing sensor histidine kinase [Anaerolineales bacterium]|nr:HAMP domain-containing sensor histidine kinase [Anaerolineales bacterium]
MLLRLRLTLLYSLLMGGVLLVFGAVAFSLVDTVLISQVDDQLTVTAGEFIEAASVNDLREIELGSIPAEMDVDVHAQVWGLNDMLQDSYGALGRSDVPFDLLNDRAVGPRFRETNVENHPLRVLSVPLKQGNDWVAVLQVAIPLDTIETARTYLAYVLLVTWLYGVVIAGVVTWFTLGVTLAPIKTIVETAEHINRADDLSRRIPHQGLNDDEIGSLVSTFNQTLERLEGLFTSQQRFLADVSHELRTPLTVIKGNVDLIRRMKQFDEESLISIDQEAGRLTRLVGGLLMLAQAESGKLPLTFKPVELDILITEVFQEMWVIAGNKVRVHLNEIDQLQVNGDRDRLKQVLINLVGNAIQYTPQDGDVYLSVAKIADQARIICRDTGPGIPAEDLPHIFERFYRAEKSRTRGKSTGFGLGLSITKWIVELHGGRIEVDSKDDEGTTFAIWLPILTKG